MSLLGVFDAPGRQYDGPVMILPHKGDDGAVSKNFLTLGNGQGVRCTGRRIKPEFQDGHMPRQVQREVESVGGLPFSPEHWDGIARAREVQERELLGTPRSNASALGAAQAVLGETQTGASIAMMQPVKMQRATTPPFRRGHRGRIGTNRNDINRDVDRPLNRGKPLNSSIDIKKRQVAPTNICHIPVDQRLYGETTRQVQQEGEAVARKFNMPHPDQMYFNEDTVRESRAMLEERLETNQRAADANPLKTELLASSGARTSLEGYHPNQEMLWRHPNNSTMRRTHYGSIPRWDVTEKINRADNPLKGQNIAQPKPGITGKTAMAQRASQSSGGGFSRQQIDGFVMPKAGSRHWDATNRSQGTQNTPSMKPAGASDFHSITQGEGLAWTMKEAMWQGNGNPITGAAPQIPPRLSFRDLELQNHKQYG